MCTFTDPAYMPAMKHRDTYVLLFGNNCAQTTQLVQLLREYWASATIHLVSDAEALMAGIVRQTPDMIIIPGVEKRDQYFISCIKMLRSKQEIDNIPVYVYNTIPVQKDLDQLWQQIQQRRR